MIRAAAALAGGIVAVLALLAGGAVSSNASSRVLGPIAGGDVEPVIEPLPDGGARVGAAAGTAVLAPIAGVAAATARSLHLAGEGESAGIEVQVDGLEAPTAATRPEAGDHVGRFPAALPDSGAGAITTVVVHVSRGGRPLPAAALLRGGNDATAASQGGFVKPVTGAVETQPFGCTGYAFEPRAPTCPGGHFHSGIDLAAPLGTPVAATLGGTVQVVRDQGGYGLHVVIDHGGGLSSLYGHLSAVAAPDGAAVAAGDRIGDVGSTGNSTGPHLHFEIRRGGVPEDPQADLPLP